MGRKRKRESLGNDEELVIDEQIPSKRKSKKLKRKRSKTNLEDDDVETTPPLDTAPISSMRPLTLKIKLGTAEVLTTSIDNKSSDQLSLETGSIKSSSNLGDEWAAASDDVSLGGDSYNQQLSGQDEDEEAWLDALESGLVNERGYLPQIKDPTSMTVRQRAMLGSKEEELLELPLMKFKSEEIESEEMLLKKSERNKKRRLQAIKRREKHKAETVQKLLHKQSTKKKDEDKKVVSHQAIGPHLRYHSNITDGTTLSVTSGLDFPLSSCKPHPLPPPRPHCVICGRDKRYSDSKSHSPLCSLECYNKLHQKISHPIVTSIVS